MTKGTLFMWGAASLAWTFFWGSTFLGHLGGDTGTDPNAPARPGVTSTADDAEAHERLMEYRRTMETYTPRTPSPAPWDSPYSYTPRSRPTSVPTPYVDPFSGAGGAFR